MRLFGVVQLEMLANESPSKILSQYKHKSEYFLNFFIQKTVLQSVKIFLLLKWVCRNAEGRTTGGPRNEQFSYGGLSTQPVLSDDVSVNIFSLLDRQAFYKHCVFIDSYMCTRIKFMDEGQSPLGFNQAHNCHTPFPSPLNKQQHPEFSYTDRTNVQHIQGWVLSMGSWSKTLTHVWKMDRSPNTLPLMQLPLNLMDFGWNQKVLFIVHAKFFLFYI